MQDYGNSQGYMQSSIGVPSQQMQNSLLPGLQSSAFKSRAHLNEEINKITMGSSILLTPPNMKDRRREEPV
jgi:hypothetical protein